jgi:hypothetical protein
VDAAAFKRAADATNRSLTDADIPALADRASMLARMEALAKEVAEVKDTLAAVGRQLADLQAQLEDLKKRLSGGGPAMATPGPFTRPAKVTTLADGVGDATSPVVDADGTLYMVDPTNHNVRSVTAAGVASVVAGAPAPKDPYVDGPVAKATLDTPTGIAIELGPHRSFFITDGAEHVLRDLDLDADGGAKLVTAAGTGKEGTNDEGDPGPATMKQPVAVAVARDGTVFVADAAAGSLRYMQQGKLKTVKGVTLSGPRAVAVGPDNRLYVAQGSKVLRLVPTAPLTYKVDDLGTFGAPSGLAVAPNGSVLVVDGHRLLAVDPSSGQVGFSAGGTAVGSEPHLDAEFGELTGVAPGAGGVLFVTDKTNHRVWKLQP